MLTSSWSSSFSDWADLRERSADCNSCNIIHTMMYMYMYILHILYIYMYMYMYMYMYNIQVQWNISIVDSGHHWKRSKCPVYRGILISEEIVVHVQCTCILKVVHVHVILGPSPDLRSVIASWLYNVHVEVPLRHYMYMYIYIHVYTCTCKTCLLYTCTMYSA